MSTSYAAGTVQPAEPRTLGSWGKQINASLILVGGAVATALIPGNDGVSDISTVEIVAIVIAALRGVLAFGVRPEWGKVGEYLPLIITALLGAASQLTASLDDGGFQGYELAVVITTLLTALGSTYVTSNAAMSDRLRSGPVASAYDSATPEGGLGLPGGLRRPPIDGDPTLRGLPPREGERLS